MSDFVDSLQTRYDAVLQSVTDPDLYTAVYNYLDYIIKTPDLSALVVDESRQLNKRLKTIKNDSVIREEHREQLAHRAQADSFYPVYMHLYMRVYLTIYDHARGILASDHKMRVIIHGIDALPKEEERWRPFWEQDFKSIRNSTKEYIEQLHTNLLATIEKREKDRVLLKKPLVLKCPLQLNERTGDFSLYGKSGIFAPSSQEFKVLLALYDSPDQQASYLTLLQAAYPRTIEATKTNKLSLYDLKKRIAEKLGVDIIKNVSRVGYRLVFKRKTAKPKQT